MTEYSVFWIQFGVGISREIIKNIWSGDWVAVKLLYTQPTRTVTVALATVSYTIWSDNWPNTVLSMEFSRQNFHILLQIFRVIIVVNYGHDCQGRFSSWSRQKIWQAYFESRPPNLKIFLPKIFHGHNSVIELRLRYTCKFTLRMWSKDIEQGPRKLVR